MDYTILTSRLFFLKRLQRKSLLVRIISFLFVVICNTPVYSQVYKPNLQDSVNEKTIPESALMLSHYIQIPSVSGNELEAGQYLLDLCKSKGLYIQVFSDQQGRFNFAASLYPLDLGLPNIVFLNHIDVVPAGDLGDWDFKPFSGKIEGGMIFGRGTIDMKGMAIMQLEAIARFRKNFKDTQQPFNATILSVSGEEDFGPMGAGWVVNNYLDQLNPVAVYGEGGAGVIGLNSKQPDKPIMCVSVAEKKALWLEMKVKERTSGHGSVPPLIYANKTAMTELNKILRKKPKIILNHYTISTLKQLGEVEGGLRGFILKNAKLFKPLIAAKIRKNPLIMSTLSNTITLTRINNPAGGSTNQIAQETFADLDCRLLPGYSSKKFIDELNKKIKKKNTTISIINQSREAEASPEGEKYQLLVDALKKVYPNSSVVPILFPAVTDNNHFRSHGIPTYGINPVCLSMDLLKTIHNVNERISIANVEDGIMVYYNILREMSHNKAEIVSNEQGGENGVVK